MSDTGPLRMRRCEVCGSSFFSREEVRRNCNDCPTPKKGKKRTKKRVEPPKESEEVSQNQPDVEENNASQ